MTSPVVAAQITAQERLRTLTMAAVARAWTRLPAYDAANVAAFLTIVVPLILASQRQSIALTNAFLARATGSTPAAVSVPAILAATRNGVTPAEVYRRPFVTVWTDLKAHRPYQDAVAAGLHRATSAAATDVQLAMRETLVAVGQKDPRILGYRRVPDPGACPFCVLVAGQRYTTAQLLPIHPHCGCGVAPITAANRGDFTGKRENDLNVTQDGVTAAVAQHGELGPVLVNGADRFTPETTIAA